ncbi:DHA2 family efflux MFS transporter permease subunit [Paenibacillus validus]|uniref:DHA2 family efflux MFS transporter permease subunit n=2 Tax=Paenibacillus validus TaxID=44253 RepID=A0A7X2ZFT1_9BACL|nr:DHA2 family efflux MFS transporter permease subunit [Paenibacillus validus]MED4602625.1 DHA2 family efflux MFS transporter permease subunit [Paenibacillus validus]MED4604911.1 DHA2 family efflux MFS transporter permease subunit [Paenibacillus validus]MUG73448.1 DHA2 family efflux MFS transporter permease subunit [Paenibacillus validus]
MSTTEPATKETTNESQGAAGNIAFWPVMIGIFFGSFLALLGMSTINVAIPVLMNEFQTDLGMVQWTLTGFMLSTGIISPITGYLGDRFSTKYLYVTALIGFTLTSGLCATAWNVESLIAFRVMQGVFSGMVMPATMTIIYQVIPRSKQAYAISMWSLAAMLAPALGPTLAGWLIQSFDWRWLFYINLPFGVLAVVVAVKMIPYYRLNTPKSFDLYGFITVIISSASLLVAFSEAHRFGWASWKTLTLITVGLVSLFLFIRRERSTPQPLLNLSVFKYPRYTFTLIISCIMTISLYSGTYLTPVFLQNIQHVSAFDTGLILLPSSLAMAIFMPITGKLYTKIGPMWLIISGIVLMSVGTAAMAQLSVDIPHSYIVFWMTVRNIGIALAMMPSSNAGMEVIPRELSGHASSANNWTRQGLGSFSIGLFTTMLASRVTVHGEELAASGAVQDKALLGAQAFTNSVNDVYWLATFIVLVGIPFAFVLRNRKKPDNDVNKTAKEAARPARGVSG